MTRVSHQRSFQPFSTLATAPRAAVRVLLVATALALHLSPAIAQDSLPVTLVLRDGTETPFTLEVTRRLGEEHLAARYYDGQPWTNAVGTRYRTNLGALDADVGGASMVIAVERLASARLVRPGEATVWRFTLDDGREFDGFISGAEAPFLEVRGTNEFGATETLRSYPQDPNQQPFIALRFDRADPKSVTQRNTVSRRPEADLDVILVAPDGTQMPFTAFPLGGVDATIGYFDGQTGLDIHVMADVGGSPTKIPLDRLSRADLVEPGTSTIWRFTLRDGRELDGFMASRRAHFYVWGLNEFGLLTPHVALGSYPADPRRQPFISVLFDADTSGTALPSVSDSSSVSAPGRGGGSELRRVVDTVALRNSDVLTGTILTDEFTVQTSYGTLTFTTEQLASIRIEDAAGRTDQFVLKVGDRVSGVLQNTTVEMTLTTGATITLEKGNIASITFATED